MNNLACWISGAIDCYETDGDADDNDDVESTSSDDEFSILPMSIPARYEP